MYSCQYTFINKIKMEKDKKESKEKELNNTI